VRATRELGRLKSLLAKLPQPGRFDPLLAGISILIDEDPPEPGVPCNGEDGAAPSHRDDQPSGMNGGGRQDTGIHGGAARISGADRLHGIDPDHVAEAMASSPPQDRPPTHGPPVAAPMPPVVSINPVSSILGPTARKLGSRASVRRSKRNVCQADDTLDLPVIPRRAEAVTSDSYSETAYWVKTTPRSKQDVSGKSSGFRHQLMIGDQKVGKSAVGADAGRTLRAQAAYLNSHKADS
jgi:hypothetical protein